MAHSVVTTCAQPSSALIIMQSQDLMNHRTKVIIIIGVERADCFVQVYVPVKIIRAAK
jgi:hypothetical protein